VGRCWICGWIIVEVESRVEARNTLPPAYRAQARIIALNKFSLEEIDELLEQHGGRTPGAQP
jgi:hypothetical protein